MIYHGKLFTCNIDDMKKNAIDWFFEETAKGLMLVAVFVIVICHIVTAIVNISRDRVTAMTHMEFNGDTITFKKYDNLYSARYSFSGDEIDTLMAAFKKANKLSKFNKSHKVDFDYTKQLTTINDVVIEFRYSKRPFRYSSVVIQPKDWRKWNSHNIIILHQERDFTNYLTKYKRIYEREMRKRERSMRKLNKIIEQ